MAGHYELRPTGEHMTEREAREIILQALIELR